MSRVPLPSKLPSWLTQDEFNYLLGEFERKGFNGGINWYRAMAKTWEVTKHLEPDFKKPCTVSIKPGLKDTEPHHM